VRFQKNLPHPGHMRLVSRACQRVRPRSTHQACVAILCDDFSPLRYLSIAACLHAHCQTREQFERWAQQQCIAVDTCAAFLASQGLSERLVQLRLQYDVSVPSVAHFALTLKENSENLRKFSLAVDRCRDAGFVHDDDQETYDILFGSSLKRIALSAAPPSVMAASLIAMIGPYSERDMLRWLQRLRRSCPFVRVRDPCLLGTCLPLPHSTLLRSTAEFGRLWPSTASSFPKAPS
jgi:hypothetical protein